MDLETGFIKVLRVVSANDVGRAINPALVEGQIEGAVVQAEGYVLTENFITKNGQILTDQLSTYLIPTILDIPEAVEFGHPGGERAKRTLRGARPGGITLPAAGSGGSRSGTRCHRRLVQRVSSDAGTGAARTGEDIIYGGFCDLGGGHLKYGCR